MKSEAQSPTITAAHIATALVAAFRDAGLDPAHAFSDRRGCAKARIIAAAGCVARLGWSKLAAAKAFKIDAIRLAPSNLVWAKIGADQLLTIAEALEASGLTKGADAAAGPRFRAPYAAEKPKARPRPPVQPKTDARPSGRAPLRPAAAAQAAAPAFSGRREPRSPSAPRRIAAVADTPSHTLRRRADIQMRPISERGLGFIRRFLESGAWKIEEVADLFDTHPNAIADAMAGPMGVAA